MKKLFFISCILLLLGCEEKEACSVLSSRSDLVFSDLATSWDEAMPLGNGTIGALVWNKDSALRFSLDRTDLWDLRPVDSLAGANYRFSWVKEQIRKGDYRPVQQKFDDPYVLAPAPSKIPGAAIEFPLEKLGKTTEVRLFLHNALCRVKWENGAELQTFVQASQPVGWFVFRNLPDTLTPVLLPPVYTKAGAGIDNAHSGQDLVRLGYKQGTLRREGNRISYRQQGWGDFVYEVVVQWEQKGSSLYGVWSITSSLTKDHAPQVCAEAIRRGIKSDYADHMRYWDEYWNRTRVCLPDSVLQKQYQNEMYKFGSVARENSYPISLQAVWTADNGKLPPWKGDFHHDLNTQLSYWPAYTGNRLQEGLGYLNTLWSQRGTYREFTAQYFESEGLNVPGVASLQGKPMGGWIQYAMSQTTGAWLAQHFYLHWKYSADRQFLKERAYPFIKDVAVFLEQISTVNAGGVRTLEISSSPEIFDNSIQAWFKTITNYDLALIRFLFKAAAETAAELGYDSESAHWAAIEKQFPDFDTDPEGGLTFAKGFPYDASHRHFSHAMAIHPLGLIDWSDGERSQRIIRATLERMEACGPDYWTGYSYCWFANMKARAFDGEGAARALKTFAECFCLRNTFHANGDQLKSGKSRFTYRPFTLEGNFAFAAGIHEMLLQSHTGVVAVFPAVPADWQDVSFENLRAMGGFWVSAQKEQGKISRVRVYSETGGTLKIAMPDTVTVQIPANKWVILK